MNKKKILVILRTAFASRTAHHVLSLLLTGLMLGGIGLTLRADIEDIKFYVQSVLERDPNFKIIQESVSENMIRGEIDIETELVEDEEEKTLVSNDTKNGYDSYTPKQPSQSSSNSSSFTTSSNSSSNNNSNTSNSNNNNSNNNNVKQEEVVDKSNFYGKDAIISEGQPFNPMNALQLYACDITGENITNSITITENNVDIYKPGIYNVKASIVLKNGKTLDKKFAVRVEPTVLDLAVNDVKTSKTELKKEEDYTMNFAVNSSKSYIDVEKVVINKNEYEVEKVFEDDVERYSVDLEAPNKAGNETLKLQKVIMSDKTIVDVNKAVNINVLKEDATLEDVIIKDESNENNTIGISFKLKDVDNIIKEPKICIYDEENNLILEQKFSKNKYSSFTKVSTKVNLNKAGIYTVKILANKNDDSEKYINESNSVELFSKDISVNIKEIFDEEDINILPLSLNNDNEEVSIYSENNETKTLKSSIKEESKTYNVTISGYIADNDGKFPPGTLQVTVPTTAAFIINNKGNFTSSNITVRNNGIDKVDIYAYKFIDDDGERNINIKSVTEFYNDLNTIPRNDLALYIYGNEEAAYFKSESIGSGNNGVYRDSALQISTNNSDGVKISTVNPGLSDELKFVGVPGKKEIETDTAISNTFTLILKIKKSTN
ncbi:hypothetical protein [Clostridium disporicum]|uniref:hypothetical protein n=1 Tax=Clostridium disporicum TaxID=84024 RepID=UPI00321C05C0